MKDETAGAAELRAAHCEPGRQGRVPEGAKQPSGIRQLGMRADMHMRVSVKGHRSSYACAYP